MFVTNIYFIEYLLILCDQRCSSHKSEWSVEEFITLSSMDITKSFFSNRWIYHLTIWVLTTLFIFVLFTSENSDIKEKYLDTLTIIFPAMLLTYMLFYTMDFFFQKKLHVLFAIIVPIITVLASYFAAYFSVFIYGTGSQLDLHQWIQNMSVTSFIVIVSRIAKKGIVSQFKLKQLQVDKLEMELYLLRSQLNPHFLFNTINNICGVNQQDSNMSTEMLINLAELLRYHLEFSKMDKIPLSHEIQLIESYVALESMRSRNNCTYTFTYTDDTKVVIAPLLLFPFVENAFKHGTHNTQKCFIDISIDVRENQVLFAIKNSIVKNKTIVQNHIGQKNTLKRLQLIYPDRHNIVIKEQEGVYTVQLTINS